MRVRDVLCLAAMACALAAAAAPPASASAHQRFVHAYGHEFSVIGNPGNAAYVYHPSPNPNVPPINIGRVDYTYAISTTEVTGSQWFRFVEAYAPFVDRNLASSSSFTSNSAIFQGSTPRACRSFSTSPRPPTSAARWLAFRGPVLQLAAQRHARRGRRHRRGLRAGRLRHLDLRGRG